MTDTYLFFADWPEPEIDPLAPEVIEINGETINVSQNEIIAVAYPGDWLTVYGGSDDAE